MSTFSLNDSMLSPSGTPIKARGFSSPNSSMTSENLDMTPRYRSLDQITNERMAIYNNAEEFDPGLTTLTSLDEEDENVVHKPQKVGSPEPKVEAPSVVPKVDTWNDNYKPPSGANVKVSPTKSKQKFSKNKPVCIRGGGGKNATSVPSWMVKNVQEESPVDEEADNIMDDQMMIKKTSGEKHSKRASADSARTNSFSNKRHTDSSRNIVSGKGNDINTNPVNNEDKRGIERQLPQEEPRSSTIHKQTSGSLETLSHPHKHEQDKTLWKSSDSGFQENIPVDNLYSNINNEHRIPNNNHIIKDSQLDIEPDDRLELVTHNLSGFKNSNTNGINGHYQHETFVEYTQDGTIINHLDTSDLSSEVFTDTETPSKPKFIDNNKLYHDGDSPNSELLNSRTPCSTRHNSLDSELDDKDSDIELNMKDQKSAIKPKVKSALLDVNDVRSKLGGKDKNMNGITKSPSKKPDTKNVRAKVGSTANIHHRPGGGNAKIESQKLGFVKKAKSKVNSFGNFNHVPGGGNEKIYHQHMDYGSVETRTDTHGVEVYAHLPTEFQEIARRLARQDAELQRQSSSSGSSARSRSRSRATSRASSRASSTSPSRSQTRHAHLSCLSGSVNSLTSPLTHNVPFKATPRPVSRSSSLRSIPSTPALSHTHPATYSTLHSSRPSSRAGSRNASPVRNGDRSRNSSPSYPRRPRDSSPEKQSHTRLRDSSPPHRNKTSKSPVTSNRMPNGRRQTPSKSQGTHSTITPKTRVHRPIRPGDGKKITNGYQRGQPIMTF